MVLEYLFCPSFFIHPPPVHPYFYPSTAVFTHPYDGWTGLCITLCYPSRLNVMLWLPWEQCKFLLENNLEPLSLLGYLVTRPVVAVAVLQHQAHICHKLCDTLVFPALKLLIHCNNNHWQSPSVHMSHWLQSIVLSTCGDTMITQLH